MAQSLSLVLDRWKDLKSTTPTIDMVDSSSSISNERDLGSPCTKQPLSLSASTLISGQCLEAPGVGSEPEANLSAGEHLQPSRQPSLVTEGRFLLVDDNKINLQV